MKISELPEEVRDFALKNRVNDSDNLRSAFVWANTKEGDDYWQKWYDSKPSCKNNLISNVILKEEPKYYDNSKGSLYKFCDEHELNSYEFDIIKRVMRCRKKGLFLEDLEKTKFLIDLYIKEQLENNK
jgi:hypothetical protein